jgi:hypothetical protein
MADEPQRDGFDDWCRVRDDRERDSESERYVSPDVIGAGDLDHYGHWQTTPDYGAVWVPAVASGWAPYHYGHWAWIEPWGWTWVDDEPWGFAPFHYGRWVYDDGAWGWVPGPRVVRPVYAPALVAWVGGGGVSVGISIGGAPTVGWFPLGYGEPYIPPYGGSRNYFRQVNVSNTRITNITQVTNNYYVNNSNTTINRTTVVNNNTTTIVNNNVHNNVHIRYANEKIPGAVTAVPGNVLTNSQPVQRAALRVPPGQWKHAEIASAPPVAPTRQSVLGARADQRGFAPPERAMSRQVVRKMAAPPRPIPFSAKQEALQHNPGRPLDRNTEQALRTRIARQQVNRPGNVAQQEPFAPRPANHQLNSQQQQQMPQARHGFRPAPQPNRQAGNGEQMPPQYRNVPRPPERGNASQPGFRSFGSQQGESHAVPQPPAQNNRPGFRSFGQPQNQARPAPQPSNHGMNERRGMENQRPQPRAEGNQPNGSGQFNRGGNQGGAARPSYSRPNQQPARVERQAPRSEGPSGGGREVNSRPSNSPPPQQNRNTKDESKPDKRR